MDKSPTLYEARCVCGHSLEIPAQRLGRHVICPMCNRTLIPLAAVPIADVPIHTTLPPASALRPCPACGEMILKAAHKCRYCGEFVDAPGTTTAAATSATSEPTMTDPVFDVAVSQWDNFWRYLTGLVILVIAAGAYKLPPLQPYAGMIFAVVLTVDVFAAFLIYFGSRNHRCLIDADRVETQSGIFTKHIDWISLSSVLDIQLRQGVLQRMLGIGTIEIRSNDQMTPLLEIHQIPQAQKVFEYLQRQISRRHQQGVARLI
ncbi:MAG: PH domain-containing protein [Phycisphaerae bacterium]